MFAYSYKNSSFQVLLEIIKGRFMEIRLRKYQGFSNFPIQLPKTQGLGKLAHDFVSIKGQLVLPD